MQYHNAHTGMTSLHQAALHTVLYTDVFDYPLRVEEITRYLIGQRGAQPQVQRALDALVGAGRLSVVEGYYMLPGRESTAAVRRERRRVAKTLWPTALAYGQKLAALPFVKMVAVTGALAADNVEADADIDYLVVTEVGRLWLARLLVIGLVRRAALRDNVELCPNYFVTERALHMTDKSLFAARELAQMVPVAGEATYRRMMAENRWLLDWLPNAHGMPARTPLPLAAPRPFPFSEALLRSRLGSWAEQWEMGRKIRKFRAQAGSNVEANFSADWCKGHFGGHGQRIMEAYDLRLNRYAPTMPLTHRDVMPNERHA
ncbi:MAG: hypothetical protein H6637_08510 [Ardenticatenales bacterium]|nr:hypothetical protein [Ardenticatenales bacterium]